MKKSQSILLTMVSIIAFLNDLCSQNLDLSDFELKAHYELSSNGLDLTGNYDSIELELPIFSFGGILSRGCYVFSSNGGDSCLIETPQIYAMNDLKFAIQIDFRLLSFNEPIIQAARGYRYLGLETNSSGNLVLKTSGNEEDEISNVVLELDTWHSATLVHNTLDSITQVYLDEELVFTKKKYLNHPEDENEISNSNFASGNAFFGYWKNLRVYSTDNISSNSNINQPLLNIFPNPANSFLSIETPLIGQINYSIFDIAGRCIKKSNLNNNRINIVSLKPGIYILTISIDGSFLNKSKFIKK